MRLLSKIERNRNRHKRPTVKKINKAVPTNLFVCALSVGEPFDLVRYTNVVGVRGLVVVRRTRQAPAQPRVAQRRGRRQPLLGVPFEAPASTQYTYPL